MSLHDRLPAPGATPDPDEVYESFVGWVREQGLEPYPAQEEALIELVTGSNVILATPTGSGKSLVAAGAHFAALADGRRTFYTAPIKALVSEKFFALVESFGAERVGMLTGDAAVNPDAPIICCTAEVLANQALRQGPTADIGQVVMDEFHFYAEPDRGWAWQVPLLELPQAQFLLMSATLGDVSRFVDDLTKRTGRTTTLISSTDRPVPLYFSYATTPMHDTLTELLETNRAPIYVVHFTQAAAMERAQALTSVNVASRGQRDRIAEAIGDFRFNAGFGKVLSKLLRHGVGVHHAGMLPRYRRLVETLAQAGLLTVICGTDTLGVGINVPIRTVVLSGLTKFDGTRQRHLKVREFLQVAGRAGRAGYDTAGTVVVQAPDHEVENERLLARAGDDEKKKKRIVRKKPPEGSVSWTRQTFERLSTSPPEPLSSSFAVTHSMVLNLLARPGDTFETLKNLIETSHEEPAAKERHLARAEEIWDALLTAGVIEVLPEPDETGRTVRLTVDLQENFALNQPLSPFALAAFEVLDPESETYALDVVSVVEATIENPRPVLSSQQFKARGEAVAEMKAEGIEYEERMELLEEVTHPQPLRDLIEGTFEIYRQGHPWVADFEPTPKSVVRDMYERAMTFAEYVSFYGLARSEGLLLRYLSDVVKALRQTVPESARTDELNDLTEWLGELVRQTDSSLIDEWESLRSPGPEAIAASPTHLTGPPPVTQNLRAFTVLVRNALFRRVELAARERYDELGALDVEAGWGADAWADAMDGYWDEHDELPTGPDARGPKLFLLERGSSAWTVRQIFDDPAGDHDWGISATVDLAASDEAGAAVVTVTSVGRLDGV
ncbi:DEAD/DEAH box helicase [Spongisporangium articulatum]|uniref:DEAD/DEAH box helicase n=1 Tax=Spongisporangium articulatum TaxID=3362603 RepID=A0ABW8AH27_9ACTN